MPDEVFFRRQRDLTLVTRGRRTGRPHRVTLWFAFDGRHLCLMAYARRHGRGTDWYRNLRRHRSADLSIGQRRYRGTWVSIEDAAAVLEEITALFVAKYGLQMVNSYYTESKRLPVRLRLEPTSAS